MRLSFAFALSFLNMTNLVKECIDNGLSSRTVQLDNCLYYTVHRVGSGIQCDLVTVKGPCYCWYCRSVIFSDVVEPKENVQDIFKRLESNDYARSCIQHSIRRYYDSGQVCR